MVLSCFGHRKLRRTRSSAVRAPVESALESALEPPRSHSLPRLYEDCIEPWQHPVQALVQLARQQPSPVALHSREGDRVQAFTYRQLWDRSYSIARGLANLPGWSSDDGIVALHCPPDAHWVFFTYALWILGKRPLNFGLDWPPTTRNIIAERHSIKFILYSSLEPGRIENVTAVDGRLLPLLGPIPHPSLDLCAASPEMIAYLATSGTTGLPKTFPVPYTMPSPLRIFWGVTSGSTGVFQMPSFGVSVASLVLSINTCGSMMVSSSSMDPLQKAADVIFWLDKGMQILQTTPSFLKVVLRMAQIHQSAVVWPAVTRLVLVGEMIPPSLVKTAKAFFPSATIHCGYGSIEMGVIRAFGFCTIDPDAPAPSKLVYSIANPNVRPFLLDDEGSVVDSNAARSGILCLALPKDHHVRFHASFVHCDRADPLSPFGFLEDGSPCVRTMDEVELVGNEQFVILGRFGRKVKINGVFVDLQYLESMLLEKMCEVLVDCTLVQTLELKIVLFFVLKQVTAPGLGPRQVLDLAASVFALRNVPNVPLHNCIPLDCIPLTDSGKRDQRRLQEIAERADLQGLAISYPLIDDYQTPLSRVALRIAQLGSQIIDSQELERRNYYIAGVGFDSLSASRLSLALKTEYCVEVPPPILLSHGMTPNNVAQIILDISDSRPFNPAAVDLAAEVAKRDDPSVTANGLPPFVFPASPRAILLTGATGFLGAFLLFELAAKFPAAQIVCLVRAPDEPSAKMRVERAAWNFVVASRDQSASRFRIMDRVTCICGDLCLQQWGISDQRWAQLAKDIDVIVHNGAKAHWLQSYERLCRANVEGTITALRLATTHHLKVVHYISTTGTLPASGAYRERLSESVYAQSDVSGGYAQTKWASEQLINKARSRGVPATIIRPGVVGGDSIYGVSNTKDSIWKYIRGCIEIGAAPSHVSVVSVNMDPVDLVAQIVAAIVASPESLSRFVFHVSDLTSRISERDIFEAVTSLGWNVMFQTRGQFRQLLVTSANRRSNALFPLMDMVMSLSFTLDSTNTNSIFTGIRPTAINTLRASLRYLELVKYLPASASRLMTSDSISSQSSRSSAPMEGGAA
ncbi:male sterility protein-domain-containing protein [Polychytrium aggregatum]|uniref:male sterility protein-domain-containing protein n=1 Tax=Polychytrium aggregatum TaxID=110093 RepID=UPI0022FDDF45|nr:male sterility protein-domain-containing protein [Polychytrium aggregatum]KAI9206803.1 male sterility protein-domain-containing protein [Polychytrium aggregatum]